MSNALSMLDREHLIHPVTAWRNHERKGVRVLVSGKGAYLTDSQGIELLDGFAGLWCVNIGYGHEAVVRAAAEQMQRLPYATGYFGFGSEPAIRLAAEVAELAPGECNHVYFTLGGSDAIDSAVRFIRYFQNAMGRPQKKNMIALERGYHGSTSFGSGLTGLPVFHQNFDALTPLHHHIPSPYPYRNPVGSEDGNIIAASIQHLRDKVEALGGPDTVAAFFCEPIQGSGGVIVPPAGWFKAMREVCRELDILFVADEVITGFGRTGPMLACDEEHVEPDILILAKGLTSGYAPMGAVILSNRIYRAIADFTPEGMPIGHGFTYSGHPVSAAVALQVLKIYREGGMLANGQKMGTYLQTSLRSLSDHPLVGEVRGRGLLAALELVTDKQTKLKPDKSLKIAERVFELGYQNKLVFRAFADDVIGLAPPLCCTTDDIDLLVRRLTLTLNQLLDIPEVRHVISH